MQQGVITIMVTLKLTVTVYNKMQMHKCYIHWSLFLWSYFYTFKSPLSPKVLSFGLQEKIGPGGRYDKSPISQGSCSDEYGVDGGIFFFLGLGLTLKNYLFLICIYLYMG